MSKKIKIIELYNMIANRGKIPKKIMYDGEVYHHNILKTNYFRDADGSTLRYVDLNDKVEILEDNTEEIEELDMEKVRKNIWTYNDVHKYKNNLYCLSLSVEHDILPKINELVKAYNKLRKEKE